MEKKSADMSDLSQFRASRPDRGFRGLISTIENSQIAVADLSAAALCDVLDGVIAGEGPDALLNIDAAASKRTDEGRFDNLLVKSVAHCGLARAGRNVPPRQMALAPSTPHAWWTDRAANADIDGEVLDWIASHVRSAKRVKSSLA
jgi:hypothetical protein